ncbi:LLM class flavin-dependent oxidoreductase [Saccharopolyspora hirsuta]|uniref:LLM class flavin-dependent oxidoreductase n=1 Tax=Saccharopolyspora hirsuta TaxID=1837 RepID=A0A5M7BEF9_SACHI|nr:LLM class flavin-dependent oxidoreductase [Saccharopolyspora hirsuta]KAA5826727.1 LLM class flavin-dependent oxidoreductase [Saccharopolyspora hirsuta]
MSSIAIGVSLPTTAEVQELGPTGIGAAARRAEAVGLDSVSTADVLVGDGTPALEAVTVLATAAAVTERIQLDFGVLSVPTRPEVMLAAQVQTLQYLSGNRVRLGLGIGGFPGTPFWQAVGAPTARRGRLLDSALRVLPGLISGEPTALPDAEGEPQVALAPGVPVPPLLIGGGTADPVLRRAAAYGDHWLPSALTPEEVASAAARLREFAAEAGRPVPRISLGLHSILGAGVRSERDALLRELGEFFGMTPEKVSEVVITGSPQQAAERIAAYAEAGVDELAFGVDGSDYHRQVELIAEAKSLL